MTIRPTCWLLALLGVTAFLGRGEAGGDALLADLKRRVMDMIPEQAAVLEETVRLHRTIIQLPGKKIRPEDQLAARILAGRQGDIIAQLGKIIDLLANNSAGAFPEVLDLIRKDMEIARGRLVNVDPGPTTQIMQRDTLDTLREMISALRPAR